MNNWFNSSTVNSAAVVISAVLGWMKMMLQILTFITVQTARRPTANPHVSSCTNSYVAVSRSHISHNRSWYKNEPIVDGCFSLLQWKRKRTGANMIRGKPQISKQSRTAVKFSSKSFAAERFQGKDRLTLNYNPQITNILFIRIQYDDKLKNLVKGTKVKFSV